MTRFRMAGKLQQKWLRITEMRNGESCSNELTEERFASGRLTPSRSGWSVHLNRFPGWTCRTLQVLEWLVLLVALCQNTHYKPMASRLVVPLQESPLTHSWPNAQSFSQRTETSHFNSAAP